MDKKYKINVVDYKYCSLKNQIFIIKKLVISNCQTFSKFFIKTNPVLSFQMELQFSVLIDSDFKSNFLLSQPLLEI